MNTDNLEKIEASKTFENLKQAFFEEASLAFRYHYFSIIAEFDGLERYSELFKEFAEGGTQSVHGCLDFLRLTRDPSSGIPLGNTQKNLESLSQTETQQVTEIYPEMARVAREEGFSDIASWFDTLEKLKRSHLQKLKKATHEQ